MRLNKMKKLTSLLIVGLCLAVTGLAQDAPKKTKGQRPDERLTEKVNAQRADRQRKSVTGQKLIPSKQLRKYDKNPAKPKLTSGAKYDKQAEAKEALQKREAKRWNRSTKPTRATTKYDNNDRYREVEGRKLLDQLMEIELLIKEHAKGYENEEPHERQIRKIVSELMKKARTQ